MSEELEQVTRELFEYINEHPTNKGHKCLHMALQQLQTIAGLTAEAERRGEERGWKAARRATNGCVISMDYSEGGGPRFVAISDWRASEEYKEGK